MMFPERSAGFFFGGSAVVPLGLEGCMDGKRITKRLVDSLGARESEFFVWDSKLPGFGIRVQPSGVMSYVVKYRAGIGRKAPTRRLTLGRVGKVTPDKARALAKGKLGDVAHGLDPAAVRSAERRAATLKELADVFLSEHVELKRKPATAAHYRDILERIVLPELGTRQADKVTTAELARLHVRMKKQPYQATRVLAVVGSLYTFSSKRHLVSSGVNPARGIDRYPEKARERFLTADELGRLGDAIREAETVGLPYTVDEKKTTAKHAPKEARRRTVIDPFAAAAIRLLILTVARLREILKLEWQHVDLERGLLLLPDSKTGAKSIILNAPAIAVLAGLKRAGKHVVAGQSAGTAGEKPRADLNRPWHSIAKRAGLVGLRIHDLRHTHASFGAGALGLPIIGKLLGHARASTTQRYAHLDNDPLRRASQRIGSKIAAAMGESVKNMKGEIESMHPARKRRR
jgi:integrase